MDDTPIPNPNKPQLSDKQTASRVEAAKYIRSAQEELYNSVKRHNDKTRTFSPTGVPIVDIGTDVLYDPRTDPSVISLPNFLNSEADESFKNVYASLADNPNLTYTPAEKRQEQNLYQEFVIYHYRKIHKLFREGIVLPLKKLPTAIDALKKHQSEFQHTLIELESDPTRKKSGPEFEKIRVFLTKESNRLLQILSERETQLKQIPPMNETLAGIKKFTDVIQTGDVDTVFGSMAGFFRKGAERYKDTPIGRALDFKGGAEVWEKYGENLRELSQLPKIIEDEQLKPTDDSNQIQAETEQRLSSALKKRAEPSTIDITPSVPNVTAPEPSLTTNTPETKTTQTPSPDVNKTPQINPNDLTLVIEELKTSSAAISNLTTQLSTIFKAPLIDTAALGSVISTSITESNKNLAETIISGMKKVISDLPQRFDGGPVDALQPYIVGEKGPELFLSKSQGTIIPLNKKESPAGSIIESPSIVRILNYHSKLLEQIYGIENKQLDLNKLWRDEEKLAAQELEEETPDFKNSLLEPNKMLTGEPGMGTSVVSGEGGSGGGTGGDGGGEGGGVLSTGLKFLSSAATAYSGYRTLKSVGGLIGKRGIPAQLSRVLSRIPSFSTVPSAIPPIPGSLPPIPGTVPPIPGSLPPIPGTVPPIPGSIPPIPGTVPSIPRTPAGLSGKTSRFLSRMPNMGMLSRLKNLKNLSGKGKVGLALAGIAGLAGLTELTSSSGSDTDSEEQEDSGFTPSNEDLSQYFKFGSESGDKEHFDDLDPEVRERAIVAAKEYQAKTGKKLQINSAYRSQEEQDELLEEAERAGRPKRTASGHPIAEHSRHTHGRALDIQNYNDPEALEALKNAGFTQNVRGDAPHFELSSNRVPNTGNETLLPPSANETADAVKMPSASEAMMNFGIGASGKIFAAKNLAKFGEKTLAKSGGKTIAKSLLKKIPGAGLAAGALFGAGRAMEGDYVGALGEVASGALGPLGLGIDAWLAYRDYEKEQALAAGNTESPEFSTASFKSPPMRPSPESLEDSESQGRQAVTDQLGSASSKSQTPTFIDASTHNHNSSQVNQVSSETPFVPLTVENPDNVLRRAISYA